MDAPIYSPSIAFELPLATTQPVSLKTASVAELKAMPQAWAIILKRLPALEPMVGIPIIQPHLENFTVYTLSSFFKGATPETFAAIDEELSHLPPLRSIAP